MTDLPSILLRLNWVSVVDILLVSIIFYGLLTIIQGTQAVQLVRGLMIIVVITVLLTSVFQLTAFSWLIRNSLPALLVAIPVVFQPELRRLLERLGRSTGGFLYIRSQQSVVREVIQTISQACARLSLARHGALIVLERETGLQDIIETGVSLNARVSQELLLTIFFPNTALHDGAVIIRQDHIVAAACVLPLSTANGGDRHLGTRHRAALGITEASDAIAVVVSEETGIISIAHNGRIIRRLDEKRLAKILTALYRAEFEASLPGWLQRLRHLIKRE
ncbi:MAG: diadenylate cyclase CdaA [Anaerolineae bacterium]